MRHKISFKLTLYIMIVVLLSTLTVGAIFIKMYNTYTFENRSEVMMNRARNISELVTSSGSGQMHGLGGLMRFIDIMSEARVWILNSQGEIVQITGKGMMGGNAGGMGNSSAVIGSNSPLPTEAKGVVDEVLKGIESTSRGFSGVYNEATLTVATPIIESDGTISGAVLLHSPINGITETTAKAIRTLALSILAAMLLAVAVAWAFSRAISKPLLEMNAAAHEMAGGNYGIRTEVKSQDEIGELSKSLNMLAWELGNTMEELEREEKMRRDFVANVSHEFRTPLTIIQGSLEALLDDTVTKEEEQKEFIKRMLMETKGLERLVGDLLELSKLQKGAEALKLEELSISEVIQDVTRSFAGLLDKKGIHITHELFGAANTIQGDYDRIVQLFKIFLDNSIKFSRVGGLIHITAKTEENGNVLVTIEDQGIGIAAEDLPYVWDRFYKGEKSRAKENASGTGLGLSIAKSIMEAHGGEVSLSSVAGKGTIVTLRFNKL